MSLASGLLSGLGALSGFLGNTTAARTTTTNSTSTPNYTADQSKIQGTVASTLLDRLTKGYDITPALTSGADTINKTYAGGADQLTKQFAARGFGKSGSTGEALAGNELGREGAIGSLDASLQKYALDENNKTLDEAENFGFRNPGTTSSGTSVGPGSPLAGGLSGGVSTYLLQNYLDQLGKKP